MLEKIKDKITLAAIAAPIYAADQTGGGTNYATYGDNSVSLSTGIDDNFSKLKNVSVAGMISSAINIILIVVSVTFFFILVIGGLKWITSGGDEKKVAAARAQITNALIGLAIVFAAWAILALIKSLFGVDIGGTGFNLPKFY